MADTEPNEGEQAKLWNGPSGRAWVESQSLLDQILQPIEDLLVEAVASVPRGAVLDVGCGTGSTTLAIARRLGTTSRVVGIDISEPMITAARDRAEREGSRASFVRDDAQTHAFDPAGFDAIVSRFGVMFFDDFVEAFANLRRAASNDAELRLFAWRSAAENPFMTTAERAAAPLLPNLPVRRPNAPGQFAFADRARVEGILHESGWTDLDLRPIDAACRFPEAALTDYVTRLGPVGLTLGQSDEETRRTVTEVVRAAFDPYVHGDEVRFTAACWSIGARARSSSGSRP